MAKLNAKQQRFVQEYCQGKTASEAALIAGYSTKRPDVSGSKLLKDPNVQAAIAAHRAKVEELTAVNAAWVQEQLVDTYKCAKAKKDYNAANRSLELLGKSVGMFKDGARLEVNAVGGDANARAVVHLRIG